MFGHQNDPSGHRVPPGLMSHLQPGASGQEEAYTGSLSSDCSAHGLAEVADNLRLLSVFVPATNLAGRKTEAQAVKGSPESPTF